MSAAVSQAPVASTLPCPYTAGGCPLFNTILPPESPRCTGGCSPAPAPAAIPSSSSTPSASTPATSSVASTPSLLASSAGAPRPSSSRASTSTTSIAYDNALLFSELQSDVPLPLPSALLKQDTWASYLDFAVSPGPVEMPFFSPLPEPAALPGPSSVAPSACAGAPAPSAAKHTLWDIEELVPPTDSGYASNSKRTRLTPPPVGLPYQTQGQVGDIGVLPQVGGFDAGLHSPSASSDEEKEVITPFISKLTYLLEHEEYRPWVRWDARGENILIAHTKPHLLEILARYFRHTTVASFVRQLNIYGFKRASTSSLLTILDTVSFPSSVVVPGHVEPETFSAADYSAFSNPAFFRSIPGPGGRHCRLGALKPITKERGPRNRRKGGAAKRKADNGSGGENSSPELVQMILRSAAPARSATRAAHLRSSRSAPPRFSSTSARPPPPRTSKDGAPVLRNAALGVAIGGAFFLWDREFNASSFARSIRTAIFGITLALDFKFNFDANDPTGIEAIHERTAKRLSRLIDRNQGMYIKLAQSLAIQAAILPKPYREAFAGVFDNAPGVEWDEVVRVFRSEFGVHPDEAFDEFERVPVASASIAQVHRARLKPKDGRAWEDDEGWVAVKIRKAAVPKQIEFDLFCYRALLWSYERLFELPVAFISQYVSEQMRKEANLVHEAQNAEKAAVFLRNDPALRDRATIPKVYWDWTGESVMTADFVKACRLTDKKRLAEWNLSLKETIDAATELFSAMVFNWGFVHADPHPGNILVRPHPSRPSHPQIVLIDHGLYIPLPEEFRHTYSLLWASLFSGDVKTIEDIAVKWGIRRENSNIFASLTLLRPHKLRKKKNEEEQKQEAARYDQGVGLKERIKNMLESEELIPRELIFVTRAMRMMQGNNQAVGSPSNRINILAHYAAKGLAQSSPSASRSLTAIGLRSYLSETFRLAVFRVVLFAVDVGFLFTRLRAWFMERFGQKGEGLEDLLQRQVTDMARQEFGVELDDAAFAG
ncbi:hypothetical protein JCM10207_008198 [Rhodosporidiobolus poonsookiae]